MYEAVNKALDSLTSGDARTAEAILLDMVDIYEKRVDAEARANEAFSTLDQEILAESLAEDSAVEAMVLEREGVAL